MKLLIIILRLFDRKVGNSTVLKRRILWILNHETLSKFELPLIRDLGFEIYTPKVVPKDILQRSGFITYEYDNTLTIPSEDLEKLNDFNFYENIEMPLHIRTILNNHFDIAFVMFDFYAVKKLVDSFLGHIFARAFGLGEEITYYDITKDVYGEDFFYSLEQIKERFWFSQCYDNISLIESGIYKEKAVYMPLGLPEEFYEIENQWTGGMDKLLFFCTRIKLTEESEQIYNKFKHDFSDFDYLIAGNQPIPVDDSKVTGFLERDALNRLYKECSVMFYHSTYPRHVHYHPLEAMIAGMPVVYLNGGLLSFLGGEQQAGCCKDISEARSKIKRILNGDMKLIKEIQEDQREILNKFSYKYNRDEWEKNFLTIVDFVTPTITMGSPKKVSVFTSYQQLQHYSNEYIAMVKMLSAGLQKIIPENRVIFNVPAQHFDIERDYSILIESGIDVREYKQETISHSKVKESLSLMFKQEPLWYENYMLPVDHARNNVDADYWLFLFHQIDEPIAPIKPFGIYVGDIENRYYEKVSSVRISNLKKASFIFTCSERTKQDLVKHLGIREEKIFMLPYEVSSHKVIDRVKPQSEYILIETDLNGKVVEVLNEISDYYNLFRTDEQIKIYLNTCENDKSELFIKLNDRIRNTSSLKDRVTLYAGLRNNEYRALYAHAKKIIYPHHISGEMDYRLIMAASFGKNIVLDEYPLYCEIESMMNYKFSYIKSINKKNMLLEALSFIPEDPPVMKWKDIHIDGVKESEKVWRKIL